MAITLSGTSVTFNNGNVVTTATPLLPTFGAVGSTIIAGTTGAGTVSQGSTIAGSSLKYSVNNTYWFSSNNNNTSYGLTGTWTVMGPLRNSTYGSSYNWPQIWVRTA